MYINTDLIFRGRKFFVLEERNEYEGETWRWCYPLAGNEGVFEYLQSIFKRVQDEYEKLYFEDFPWQIFEIDEYEIDVLVNRDNSTSYQSAWNKCDKQLDLKSIKEKLDDCDYYDFSDIMYKGPFF